MAVCELCLRSYVSLHQLLKFLETHSHGFIPEVARLETLREAFVLVRDAAGCCFRASISLKCAVSHGFATVYQV